MGVWELRLEAPGRSASGGSEERFDQESLKRVITEREGMMEKAVEKGTRTPFEGRLRVPQKSSGAALAVRS
jgi:hypothetical protein